MNRMTSDNTLEMNMLELALNQVYIGEDRRARYRSGPEDDLSVCDLIRTAAETLGAELPMLNDGDLSDLMADWLQYGAEEPEGVLAILYRALWAMAEVRDKLSRYEDTGLEPDEIKEHEAAYTEIMARTYGPLRQKIGQWLQAEKDGRMVVLEPAAKEGAEKPPCFYNDTGQAFCLGLARGEYNDEPTDRCKECWYCESTREEAEAALKKREEREIEAN